MGKSSLLGVSSSSSSGILSLRFFFHLGMLLAGVIFRCKNVVQMKNLSGHISFPALVSTSPHL